MDDEGGGTYNLAILGGGPAGVGVLVRAARLGYLERLLAPSSDQQSTPQVRGVVLIHGGPVETLGTGNLGEYIINSNTFAKSLVTSVLEEKPDLDPPESIRGTFLESLTSHPTAIKLMEAGNTTIGLSELGKFLAAVGYVARLEMLKHSATSTCLVNTMALKVERGVDNRCKITIKQDGGTERVIFAKQVVLAMGGKQEMPQELSAAHLSKTWLSDRVLRESGRQLLAESLQKQKDKKVCIVGGSHSAFSVAWTLLHKIPAANKEKWFQPKDITILHRAPVRCYYATKKEAEADGMVVDKIDKCGSVNTFTGLREDAKTLYQAITTGKEPRVRLFQVKKQPNPIQAQAFDTASAIVWCCGYGTNMIPVADSTGALMEFCQHNHAVEIDLKGRLKFAISNEPVEWLFGVGVGFSLRAAFDEMNTETRADGVTVYHRRGATLILAAIFGNEIYGTDCETFEQMVEKCEKRRKDERQQAHSEGSKLPVYRETMSTSTRRLANIKLSDSAASPTSASMRSPKLKQTTANNENKAALVGKRMASESFKAKGQADHAAKSHFSISHPQEIRRGSFSLTRSSTSHSSLRIDVQSPTKDRVLAAKSCGKPRSVAGGGKDAIQAIRSARCTQNQPNQKSETVSNVISVEL